MMLAVCSIVLLLVRPGSSIDSLGALRGYPPGFTQRPRTQPPQRRHESKENTSQQVEKIVDGVVAALDKRQVQTNPNQQYLPINQQQSQPRINQQQYQRIPNQQPFQPSINQQPFPTAVNQPPYQQGVNQQPYQPNVNQPPFQSAVNQQPYQPGINSGERYPINAPYHPTLDYPPKNINPASDTVDQLLNLPNWAFRSLFGMSKENVLQRLLGINSDEIDINFIRRNPSYLQTLRTLRLPNALALLNNYKDNDVSVYDGYDDPYEYRRLHPVQNPSYPNPYQTYPGYAPEYSNSAYSPLENHNKASIVNHGTHDHGSHGIHDHGTHGIHDNPSLQHSHGAVPQNNPAVSHNTHSVFPNNVPNIPYVSNNHISPYFPYGYNVESQVSRYPDQQIRYPSDQVRNRNQNFHQDAAFYNGVAENNKVVDTVGGNAGHLVGGFDLSIMRDQSASRDFGEPGEDNSLSMLLPLLGSKHSGASDSVLPSAITLLTAFLLRTCLL